MNLGIVSNICNDEERKILPAIFSALTPSVNPAQTVCWSLWLWSFVKSASPAATKVSRSIWTLVSQTLSDTRGSLTSAATISDVKLYLVLKLSPQKSRDRVSEAKKKFPMNNLKEYKKQ